MDDTIETSIQGYDILVEGEHSYQPELMPFLASKVVTDDTTEKKNPRTEHPFMLLNQRVKSIYRLYYNTRL
jgi:SWI/SNF-related matrix-associated actin-dependent regulator of chromatin subfamily D